MPTYAKGVIFIIGCFIVGQIPAKLLCKCVETRGSMCSLLSLPHALSRTFPAPMDLIATYRKGFNLKANSNPKGVGDPIKKKLIRFSR